MAIIGFIALLLVGIYLVLAAFGIAMVCFGFGGQLKGGDLAGFWIMLIAGIATLWLAFHNAPFTVTIT